MKNLIYAAIGIATMTESVSAQLGNTCHALVLSGGGSNGAWEAGVIYGLTHFDNADEYRYDVVSGVSAGAINSAGIGVWAPGEEVQGSEKLVSLWADLRDEDLYIHRPGTKVHAMLVEQSLYDTTPGFATLRGILDEFPDGFKKKVSVSAVDAGTGKKVIMTDEDIEYKDFHRAVIASASVPGAFPPTQVGDHLLIDGMTAYNTDTQATIDRCKQITGEDESLITIDIIQVHALDSVEQWDHRSPKAFQNYMRAHKMKSEFVGSDIVAGVQRAHPDIRWRHHIHQTNIASGLDELNFTPAVTGPLIDGGKADAKTAIAAKFYA